jgi:hypothetical protein
MPPSSASKLLAPPYLRESPWTDSAPLGSILIWRPGESADVEAVRSTHASAPWCSLVVELAPGGAPLDRNLIFDALTALACLPVIIAPGGDPVAAIRNRRPPTPHEIARYVMWRPGHELLGAELGHLTDADARKLSTRTLRHHLTRQSRFGTRHWTWIIQLAQMKRLTGESAEAFAARYGMEVRTLRHRVRACLDISLSEFRQLVGWEWRVEAALRLDARKCAESGGGGEPTRVDRPMIWSECRV